LSVRAAMRDQRPVVRIREAFPADVPAMHEIRLAVRENRLSDPLRVQPEDYQDRLSTDGLGFVAEADGRIVGFAMADLERRTVWALFVDPMFEGRGAGRLLHDALVEAMFAGGAGELSLCTDAGPRAERFYRTVGWEPTGDRSGSEVCYRLTRARWDAPCR
jgi:GNAT superfamily N-acetyltransferase